MKFLKVILILLYIPLTLFILITVLGLIHRWSNPEQKSLSDYDLKQLAIAITINLILIAFIYLYRWLLKRPNY